MVDKKEITRGLVSLTQIKLLAKEINTGYPFAECFRKSVLVYNIKNGRGFLKIVSNTYKLRDNEFIFLNEKALEVLAYGFYNQNTSNTIYEASVEFLYNEVNKKLIEVRKTKPTKDKLEDVYKKVKGFKIFYKKLSELPSNFYINYSDYDLSNFGMECANRAVTTLLTNLANYNDLKLKVIGDPDDYYTSYVFSYYDPNYILPTDVYFAKLTGFLKNKKLTESEYKELKNLFTFLYKVDKEDFLDILSQRDVKEYELYVEFIEYLFKGMQEINLKGLLNWYEEAKKLRGNKAAIQELAKNKGEF